MNAVEERTLRIGELADRVGVTPRTIRYYEELGLLATGGKRAKGTHRLYGEADVARLAELIRLRDLLGLSLDELVALAEAEEARAALRNQWHGDPTDEERVAIIDGAAELVRQQLELVRARQQKLEEFAGELEAKLESLAAHRDSLQSPQERPSRAAERREARAADSPGARSAVVHPRDGSGGTF